ncbi:hypothetical protein [Halobacteriovorax sp.]|uniref:hypothetical protein n=1 Tax=Halobacteriovorax sp. TaxID=2020862 RepID=UPI003567F420
MKVISYILLLALIFASSYKASARSPHESESLINNEFLHTKIEASESTFLESEVNRLTLKLERTLGTLPLDIDHNEGKIIAIISQQIENDLREVKKEIESINYQKSSNSIYIKIEQIEKDIEMI